MVCEILFIFLFLFLFVFNSLLDYLLIVLLGFNLAVSSVILCMSLILVIKNLSLSYEYNSKGALF